MALGLMLLAVAVHADPYLGTIHVYDGGTANNYSTTVRDAGLEPDGGTVVDGGLNATRYVTNGFPVPTNAKISAQCRQDSHVNAGVTGCDAGTCPRLGAEMYLPLGSSGPVTVSYSYIGQVLLSDGGFNTTSATATGAVVSIACADAGAQCDCDIYACGPPCPF